MVQEGLWECPTKVGVARKEFQSDEAPSFKAGSRSQEACFIVVLRGCFEAVGQKNIQVLCHAIPKRMSGRSARKGWYSRKGSINGRQPTKGESHSLENRKNQSQSS
jgi:hypothetical protein